MGTGWNLTERKKNHFMRKDEKVTLKPKKKHLGAGGKSKNTGA